MIATSVRAVAAAGAVFWLAGCAVSGGYGGAAVPRGSELVVHERLAVPTGSARVFVQHGKVVRDGAVDRYAVSCSLGLERRDGGALPEAVLPGRFRVPHDSRWRAQAGLRGHDRMPVMVAGMAPAASSGMGLFHRRFVDRLNFETAFALESTQQPEVDDVTCRYNGYPTDDPPTFEQIDRAFGEIATLSRPRG